MALWYEDSRVDAGVRRLSYLAAGFGAVLAVYFVTWYFPNRAELSHMNYYYRTVQIQPDSFHRLLHNINIAFFGDDYGIFAYLVRHTPVLFALAALCMVCVRSLIRKHPESSDGPHQDNISGPALIYLAVWPLSAWAIFAVSSYAPRRYFVSTYPALFALASIAVWRLPEVWESLTAPSLRAKIVRFVFVWLLAFHVIEAFVHRRGVLPHLATGILLYIVPGAAAVAAALWIRPCVGLRSYPLRLSRALLIITWGVVNTAWLADWWTHRQYTELQMSAWLTSNLPRGSVLLGDVAPQLGMETPFQTVDVQEKLCNDRDPVSVYGSRPSYAMMIDGEWRGPYWTKRYPTIIQPARRILRMKVIKWWIGVYPVGTTSNTSASGLDASEILRR